MFGKPRNAVLLVILLLGFQRFAATAATLVWTNLAGGNWNAAANWSPNLVPVAGDSAVITNSGTYAVTLNASPVLAGLTVGGTNGTITFAHDQGQVLTLNGPASFRTNTVLRQAGGPPHRQA